MKRAAWLLLALLSLGLLAACAQTPVSSHPPATASGALVAAPPPLVTSPPKVATSPHPLGSDFSQYDLLFSTGDFVGHANNAADLLARRRSDGSLWLYANDGKGGLLSPHQLGGHWGGYSLLTAGTDSSILALRRDGYLFSFPNLGGRLGQARLIGGGWDQFDTILAGDFNRDHTPDLLVRRHRDGVLLLYPGKASGGYSPARLFSPTSFADYSLLTAPGDWNGDGYIDLLARRTQDGALCLFGGNGQGGLLDSTCQPIGAGWDHLNSLISAYQWDGDSHSDLLGRSPDGLLWLVAGAGISGYSNPLSLAPCSPLTLYISSQSPTYRIDFLRFGGNQPQAWASMVADNGQVQAIPKDAARNGARWLPSATYSDTCPWPSGLYSARLSNHARVGPADTWLDYAAYVTFVVHPLVPPHAPTILVVASTNTWNAYNDWPLLGSFYSKPRPTQVSYLRPDPGASPLYTFSHLAGAELLVLQWLEAHHYAYSLITDVDINDSPAWLSYPDYYTVILSTHSEYWTDPMYNALAAYLHTGGNLLSLSGNTMYRRESLRKAHVDDSWSSLLVGGLKPIRTRAQMASLIGVAYRTTSYTCASYHVLRPNSWLLAGIKAVSFGATSQTIPAGCYHNTSGLLAGASGWETDTRFAIPGARTYQVIATGTNPNGGADLVFYQPRNGGSIVNFGSITVGGSLAVDPTLSRIVENVLSRFRAQSPPPTNPYWSRQLELQRLS